MKITVKMTSEELLKMNISEEQLNELIINRLDETKQNKMKIFHQVELEVVTKIKKTKFAKS